jgi:hypothetical protein
MRINEKMKIRNVAGENIVIMPSDDAADMTKVVALNESSLLLYNQLKGREFSLDDAVQLLLDNYDVDEATARKDAEAWLADMRKHRLIV